MHNASYFQITAILAQTKASTTTVRRGCVETTHLRDPFRGIRKFLYFRNYWTISENHTQVLFALSNNSAETDLNGVFIIYGIPRDAPL